MYNRYIPEDASYTRIERTPPPPARPNRPQPGPRRQPPLRLPDFLSGKEGLFGAGEGGGLSGVVKALHLENFDSGDILLLLILLYLLVEGDDMDLVIALGLVLLMGFWDDKEK